MRKSVRGTKQSMIDALRHVPLLSRLSRKDLERVLDLAVDREFTPGQAIVKAGDRGKDFYVLLSGTAKLTVPGRKTAMLNRGDYFGEMSVLDGGPRTATIVAESLVTCLRIGRSDFLKLLDAQGSIGRKILVEMSKRVRAAERPPDRH